MRRVRQVNLVICLTSNGIPLHDEICAGDIAGCECGAVVDDYRDKTGFLVDAYAADVVLGVVGDAREFEDFQHFVGVRVVDSYGCVPEDSVCLSVSLSWTRDENRNIRLHATHPIYNRHDMKSKSAFSGYNWYCSIVKFPLNGLHPFLFPEVLCDNTST